MRQIIKLLMEDELGKSREHMGQDIDESYIKAFEQIAADPNQYLIVVESGGSIVDSEQLSF